MGEPWGQTLNKNNELNAALVLSLNTFEKKSPIKKKINYFIVPKL
jgi:hypothetical protein